MNGILGKYFGTFFGEYYFYVVDQSVEVTRNRMAALLADKRTDAFKGMILGDKFELYPRTLLPNLRRNASANIIGQIEAVGNGKSLISVEVWPSYTASGLYIIGTIAGICLILYSVFFGHVWDLIYIGIFLLIMIHTVLWFYAFFPKDKFKTDFENALGIAAYASRKQ